MGDLSLKRVCVFTLAAVVPSWRPVCTLRGPRQRTLVISVVFLACEALVAGGAAEAVVVGVRALMLQHVSATTERLLTELTLIRLYTCRRDKEMILIFALHGII